MNAQISRQDSIMTMGDWLITLIILCIPIVNIIMLLVWAFSGGTNSNKQNFCRAYLIIFLIAFAIAIVFGIMGGFAASSLMHAASQTTY